MENKKPDCSKHKKDFHGIVDMKELANKIGDLHYQSLTEFLDALADKIYLDAAKDRANGRVQLADRLEHVAGDLCCAQIWMESAWKISKPFMEDKSINNKNQ